MPFVITLFYLFTILSCFIVMPATCRKGGWVRRFKYLYLWSVLLFPIAHLLSATYLCLLLRFLGILGAFVIICQVSCQQLKFFQKLCFLLVYVGLFLQLFWLISEELAILLV